MSNGGLIVAPGCGKPSGLQGSESSLSELLSEKKIYLQGIICEPHRVHQTTTPMESFQLPIQGMSLESHRVYQTTTEYSNGEFSTTHTGYVT